MKVVLKADANTVFKDIAIESFPFIIGRSEKPFAEMMYASREMSQAVSLLSRSHAMISEENGKLFIHDLGSSNGTRLNDQRIGPESVEIKQGDRLVIAESLNYDVYIESPVQPANECASFSLSLIAEDFQSGLPSVTVPVFPFKIGRQEDDFTPFIEKFPEQLRTLSRKHAQLTCEDDRVYVEDFKSANGTFLSGKRLTQGTMELRNGDALSFGTFFKYVVRIYPKDVEETVVLGQAEPDDDDRTIVVNQDAVAAAVQPFSSEADDRDATSISSSASKTPPVMSKPPTPANATPAETPSPSLSAHGDEGQQAQFTQAGRSGDWKTETGKTVYMSSATQFLKILTPDGDAAADEGTQDAGKGEKAVPGDGKPKSRKAAFVKELSHAFWGDAANKAVKRYVYLFILLIAAAGTGYYLYSHSTAQQLQKLWTAKQYEAYAKLANKTLAKQPDNESLQLKATYAMIMTVLPGFTDQLKMADFASASETLLKIPALTENNPTGKKTISLLEWVVDMEFYFHSTGADTTLEIFKDEDKVQALLAVWEKNRTDYRLIMDLITGKYPPFESTYSLVFHHLNMLKKEEDLIGPINALKAAVDKRVNDGQLEQLTSVIDDYERRYPDIKGLEKLRSDADNYQTLMVHIGKNDVVGAHDLLERVDFASPLFAQRVEELKTTDLPPPQVVERYRKAAEAWMNGNAEAAISLLEPLTGERWGQIAEEKLNHYRQVMGAFAELTKAKRSAGYSAKLVDFRRLLKEDEDQFYHKLIEDDYKAISQGELKRARNLFTQAQRSWESYIKSGRITGFLRLEPKVSSRYEKRAGYLKASHTRSQAAIRIYSDLKQEIPAKYETLHTNIMEEVEVQRLRVEDLKGVLGQDIATAKLKLLPRP